MKNNLQKKTKSAINVTKIKEKEKSKKNEWERKINRKES